MKKLLWLLLLAQLFTAQARADFNGNSGFATATNAANGATGGAAPSTATLVGGTDGANIRAMSVDSAGRLNLNNISGTVSLPTGAATSAKQDTGNTSLSSIDGKITAVNTGAVVVSSSALPTGAATAAKQDTGNTSLSSIDGKITAVNTGAVVVSSSALPTGAATGAKQDTGNASLASIDGKITAVNTGAVVVSSSALPGGAATAANQLNTAGSFVLNNALTTVVTETVPANSVGFILEAKDSNTANIRWAIGATATTTSGMQLQPGRDTGFIPVGANISVVAESGTLEYQLTWIKH